MNKRTNALLSAAVLVLVALVAAACGSSVPQAQQLAQTTGQGQGLTLSSPTTLPPGSHVNSKGQVISKSGKVIGTVPGAAVSGGGAPAGTTTGSGTGTTTQGGGTAAAPAPATAPGITSTKIYVGAVYAKNTGAADSALGANGKALDAGDARQMYNAVIDSVNKA